MIIGLEGTIRACEEELTIVNAILPLERQEWWKFGLGKKSSTSMRARHLFDKMLDAEKRIETLEKTNAELKKVLANGDLITSSMDASKSRST